MAKIVKDDWEFKVERIDGKVQYSAHYTVESEGVKENRGVPILAYDEANPKNLPQFIKPEQTQMFNFLKDRVKPKIIAYENIQ